jgi:hypothetical protein
LPRDALPGFGLEVWYDESDLGGGEAWDQKIRRQIRECGYFMPLVSAQTEARLEGYFQREWRMAVERTLDMVATLNVLDGLEKSGGTAASVLSSATKHWDNMWVSKYYNWHSGSWKGAYTYSAFYTLKPDAPDDAIDVLAKNLIAPLMEKLLADGTIVEYEIDEQAIHADAPGMFVIDYISPTAEGLDKFNAALHEAVIKSPLAGPAFGSMVDWTKHRDSLVRTSDTYK